MDQYELLRARRKQTTCRSLSQYIRKILAHGPVTINHRNASTEELIEELSALREQLAHARRVLESAVEGLAGLQGSRQLESWLLSFEADKQNVAGQIQSINEYIKKTAQQWLH